MSQNFKDTIKVIIVSTIVTFLTALLLIFVITDVKDHRHLITPDEKVEKVVPKKLPKEAPKEINKSDTLCLKQNILYEAGGETFLGKLAVGMVTINRHKSQNKSICTIVFEKDQFSWTTWIKEPKTVFDFEITEAAFIAQKELYKIPNLENAIYYHNIYVYPDWAKKKRFLTKLGNHLFYAEN